MKPKTLKTYIAELQAIARKHPNATVICSADDEGNSFHPVFYSPSAGTLNADGFFDNTVPAEQVTVVCIN